MAVPTLNVSHPSEPKSETLSSLISGDRLRLGVPIAMSERTDAYIAALKRHDAAFETLNRIRQVVVDIGAALQNHPERLRFVQIPNALSIPMQADLTFEGAKWPPVQEIHNALAECHAAISALKTEWANVCNTGEAYGLTPPPTDPWRPQPQRRSIRDRYGV